MNDVFSVINQRTSANNFDPSHVMSVDEITELAQFANQTPTSFNQQNWRLVAVHTPGAKLRLKAAASNQPKVGDAAVTFVVVGKIGGYKDLPVLIKPMLESGQIDQAAYDGWIKMANGLYEGKDQFQRDEAVRSGALVAMTIMLAAQGKGLASGAMIGFDPVAVSAECKLASDEIPVMLLAVGRPAPGNWPRKVRRDVGAVVSFSAD
jgi:nitroreductase